MKVLALFLILASSSLFVSLSHAEVSQCARERLDEMQCEQQIRSGTLPDHTQCPGVSPGCYSDGGEGDDDGGNGPVIGVGTCTRERLDQIQCEQSARNAGLDPNVCPPVSSGCR